MEKYKNMLQLASKSFNLCQHSNIDLQLIGLISGFVMGAIWK